MGTFKLDFIAPLITCSMSGFLSISIKALFLSLVDPILDGIKIAKFLYDNLNACKCNKEKLFYLNNLIEKFI